MVWSFQPEDKLQSKFHSGFQKIDRLDESWRKIKSLWRVGDFPGINNELDALWCGEFFADSSIKEKKVMDLISKRISRYIIHLYMVHQRIHPLLIAKAKSELSELIKTKWKYLGIVEKRQGLGKAYKDDDEDIF